VDSAGHAPRPRLRITTHAGKNPYSLTRDPRLTQGAIQILRGLSDTERECMFGILLEQP